MSRHIQFESRLSLTGANADTRILMKPSEERAVALGLLAALTGRTFPDAKAVDSELIQALRHAASKSLVISGSNDLTVQLAVVAINDALGNYGHTLEITPASHQRSGSDRDMHALISDMKQSKVDVLVVYGCNPAYEVPQQFGFSEVLKGVPLIVSLSSYLDETATQAHVVAPDHHYLEAWNDAQPTTGLFHFAQPTINPVYDTRHAGESLMAWMGGTQTFEAAMKDYWSRRMPHIPGFWRKALHDGFYKDPNAWAKPAVLRPSAKVEQMLRQSAPPVRTRGDFELEVFESVMQRSGQHANNPWLQETPDPIAKTTWGNVAQISVADGKRLGLSQGDVVRISAEGQSLELPALLQPGQMNGTISVALGYGRQKSGKVGDSVGQNAYSFATGQNVDLSKTGRHEALALTQIHYSLENRPLVKDMTLQDLTHGDHAEHEDLVMLWQQHETKEHAWGLAIDLSACTGCSGCLVSCQAENNVAVVGKDEVRRQREMHWIRIDRYYSGDLENPEVVFEPMLCQHCGNAPCESVCPVLATVHSSDGLNQQVYNRCVGTRYCANNCPYKVRRFNWFDYANNKRFDFYMNHSVGKLVLNPDVTVRSRGVMEKCSLCVQRIQQEKISAKASGKVLNPDDIKTACQQSCPSDAIVFGDRNDPKGRLAKLLEKNARAFQVLGELNVKPAVTYLAKVRNRT